MKSFLANVVHQIRNNSLLYQSLFTQKTVFYQQKMHFLLQETLRCLNEEFTDQKTLENQEIVLSLLKEHYSVQHVIDPVLNLLTHYSNDLINLDPATTNRHELEQRVQKLSSFLSHWKNILIQNNGDYKVIIRGQYDYILSDMDTLWTFLEGVQERVRTNQSLANLEDKIDKAVKAADDNILRLTYLKSNLSEIDVSEEEADQLMVTYSDLQIALITLSTTIDENQNNMNLTHF